ncbi:hypothetical protein DSCA_16760 [Desulfosarcina alkanivorans]|uniref:Sigma-54 factor interaction domain-containing protein n=1 Tax=Desulfosarcina alkanivorans TaxID=571177 RepID=A0A5K7YFD7_9BACT|nr:sigma 54-interacting transcriptional regulator [Desulfosarcina alkanivorans]BBO67746.1 hypothetical protein DSCA_16760 [Desulfosarcina alkanivorans]
MTTPFLNRDNADIFYNVIDAMGHASLGVQLSGEKGLCKEAIVRLLYARSPHSGSPFVKINCPELSVAEGADDTPCIKPISSKPDTSMFNLFRLFHQGVLYLHDVDEMEMRLQVRLLELLRRKFLAFDFSSDGHKGGMLVFSTATRPLEACVATGDVNPELGELLSGLSIYIPPLRHSVERIPQLVDYFLNQCSRPEARESIAQPLLSHLAELKAYDWPGNVRELQQVVRTAFHRDWDAAINRLKNGRPLVDGGRTVELFSDGVALMPDFEIRQGCMLEHLARKNPIEEMGLMDLVIYDEVMARNNIQ